MKANSSQDAIDMKKEHSSKPLSGWRVFAAFVAFFGVIVAVNTVFITSALRTHSGLVTEDAYKKGLSYNQTLDEARNQPNMNSSVSFENGVLKWSLSDPLRQSNEKASVHVNFMRPVKGGDDFSAPLRYEGNGLYSLTPAFPVNGAWTAQLSATWNNKTYKTTKQLIVH